MGLYLSPSKKQVLTLKENRMKRPSRPPANFSGPVTQRLNAYTLAAGAAGVGMLALTHPAEAKIIYSPANIPIVQNGGPVELDLNHDGINDFQFSNVYTTEAVRGAEGFHQSSLAVYPDQQSNRVRATKFKDQFEAAAIPKGKSVGPDKLFQPGDSGMEMWACAGGTSGGGCGGAWLKVKEAYLGLKFVIKGKIHFGWAHIRQAGETSPTIVGYAYESIPNKPIITGQTKGTDEMGAEQPVSLTAPATPIATIGLLAMGAPGLSIWRREESANGAAQVSSLFVSDDKE
jgi:hypothetical protein